jgi:hypothetical protein
MSQKIQFSEHYQTDRERMETSTWGGADAVASFEECGINLESIIEFKVSFIFHIYYNIHNCYIMYNWTSQL